MNTEKTFETNSSSYESTLVLGLHVGENLRGGEVIELIGDLGAGKTAFVHGLANGAKSSDEVSSPSFTISNLYKADKFEIHHFDFYRLGEAGIMSEELREVIGEEDAVTIIEWGEIVHDVLPAKTIRITLTHMGNDNRHISASYPSDYNYIFEGLNG